jgi:hypothetical protein
MLFLMLLFCVDCKLWNQNKVNYVFIFEFDNRHHLDWRQLAEVSHTENMIKQNSNRGIVTMCLSSSIGGVPVVQLHQLW